MSALPNNNAEQAIRDFLKSRFPRYDDRLGAAEPLDRIVDSLGLFDLVEWVEGTFDIRVPNEEFSPQKFSSIETICSTINEFR